MLNKLQHIQAEQDGDESDDTALQAQGSEFEPWQSEENNLRLGHGTRTPPPNTASFRAAGNG